MGARAVDAGDIDRDGYLDLVFANTYEGSGYIIDSYIYYGSASGFSTSNYAGITTIGAHDVKLTDLDADGWLDLAVATFRNEGQYLLDSYIFWGSSNGYSVANRTDLPTMGASSVDSGDLDGDGVLDLVFSNAYNSTSNEYAINSYIYWGSATVPHYSETDRMELPTLGTWGVTVDDVNDDGDLDIVFANRFEYSSGYAINSFLYRGDPGGANGIYSLLNRDVIATQGAWANDVEDLNGDGYRDIVFANRRGGTPNTTFVDSYIYWGSASGFSTSNRTELPTIGASDVSIGGQ
jgi:hypothetical protein